MAFGLLRRLYQLAIRIVVDFTCLFCKCTFYVAAFWWFVGRLIALPWRLNFWTKPKPVHVVIAGGNGLAGQAVYRALRGKVQKITLVDTKCFTEYTPGVLRCFLKPSVSRALVGTPPSDAEFVHALVTAALPGTVTLQPLMDGGLPGSPRERALACDYAVVCTGCEYPGGAITPEASVDTPARRHAQWRREAQRLKGARSVLVLGGGAVGTELAAEIAYYRPDVRLTLVDAQPTLCAQFPTASQAYCERWLRDRGVELVLGEWLERFDDAGCVLRSGQEIRADIVYNCLGGRATAARTMRLPPDAADPRGYVAVEDSLCVRGTESIGTLFCCGDVMTQPKGDVRLGYNAEVAGATVAHNLLLHSEGKSMLRFPEDVAGELGSVGVKLPLLYCISLGPYDGTFGCFGRWPVVAAYWWTAPIAAVAKHGIEWTKVKQLRGDHLAMQIWEWAERCSLLAGYDPAYKGGKKKKKKKRRSSSDDEV